MKNKQLTDTASAHDDEKIELRKFGFIMAGMIVFLFGLLLPWVFAKTTISWPLWPYIVSAVFALFAILFPMALKPVNSIWLKIGNVLGWINSRIILGVMFFLLIFPIGLILKVFGKDSMNRKLDKNVASYRKLSKHRDKNHLEKPF